MKKNSMGLNKHEYAAYLREQESEALRSAHDEHDPRRAAGLYDLSNECHVAARRAEVAQPKVGAVVFFAVGDVGAHDGFVTSRVVADIWTGQNPGGWTYQDVAGAHGTILHEGTEIECQAKLDSWLRCSDDRCYTHGHAA